MIAAVLLMRLIATFQPAPPAAEHEAVTYLDLSGPAEAEDEFPVIAKKGAL